MPQKTQCRDCAWFGDKYYDVSERIDRGFCHYNPKRLMVDAEWWCRHWSTTTGHLEETKKGESCDNSKT